MNTLSYAGLEALIETGLLKPVAGSPLDALKAPFKTDEGARAAAGAALHKNATWRTAASIAAHAKTLLEVTEVKRGESPFTAKVYLHLDETCAVTVTPAGLLVDSPLPLKQLLSRLANRIALDRPMKGPSVALLPSEISLVAHLWPDQGKPLTAAQGPDELENTLARFGVDRLQARQTIELLKAIKLLAVKGKGVIVAPTHVAALEAFWSGELFELTGGTVDGSRATTLMFTGAHGKRLRMQRVQAKETGEETLVFHADARGEVRSMIAALFV